MTKKLKEIEISREDAVFRLDGNGRWRNRFGRFEKKSIIDHFNRSIQRDDKGYFVGQMKEDTWEKIYFPYEDTALFVFDIVSGSTTELVLNTGRRLPLDPERLWIENDSLYLTDGGDRIKFSERALTKIVKQMEETRQGGCRIRMGERTYEIPERDTAGE